MSTSTTIYKIQKKQQNELVDIPLDATTLSGISINSFFLKNANGELANSIKFNSTSLPKKNLKFLCGIDPFTNGGEMGYCDVVTGDNSKTSLGWTNADKTSSRIPTINLLAYWNGAYNTDNNSNLIYCNGGTIASQSWVESKGYVSSHDHDSKYVKFYEPQTLTDDQKAQARKNIGAAAAGNLITDTDLENDDFYLAGTWDFDGLLTYGQEEVAVKSDLSGYLPKSGGAVTGGVYPSITGGASLGKTENRFNYGYFNTVNIATNIATKTAGSGSIGANETRFGSAYFANSYSNYAYIHTIYPVFTTDSNIAKSGGAIGSNQNRFGNAYFNNAYVNGLRCTTLTPVTPGTTTSSATAGTIGSVSYPFSKWYIDDLNLTRIMPPETPSSLTATDFNDSYAHDGKYTVNLAFVAPYSTLTTTISSDKDSWTKLGSKAYPKAPEIPIIVSITNKNNEKTLFPYLYISSDSSNPSFCSASTEATGRWVCLYKDANGYIYYKCKGIKSLQVGLRLDCLTDERV